MVNAMKAWLASKLGKNEQGKVCYELRCDESDETAMRTLLEVFFNLDTKQMGD